MQCILLLRSLTAALVAGTTIGAASTPGHIVAHLPGGGFTGDVSTTKHVNASRTRGFGTTIFTKTQRRTIFLASLVEWPSALTLLDRHRAILYGGVTGVVEGFTIFDPLAEKILSQVPCEDVSPSPDGKAIAFVRFFVPHFARLADTTLVYAVLDASSAIDNAGSGIRWVAGTRVYPVSDPHGNIKDDNDVHRLVGKIVWQSPSRFTFEDAYRNAVATVVVSRSDRRWTASVVSKRAGTP